MKEYNNHLKRVAKMFNNGDTKFYESDSYPWGDEIRKFHPLTEWASIAKAETYLERYWLSKKEYIKKWKPLQNQIFINQNDWFPNFMFKNEFLIYPTFGGKIFWEKSIAAFNNALLEIGETNIVAIQNNFNNTYVGSNDGLTFMLKYPVGIKWEELNIGHNLTDDLLIGIDQDFYIFGENTGWAMYSATRDLFPMNILAFKPPHKAIFLKYFHEIKLNDELINEYLPNNYKIHLAQP